MFIWRCRGVGVVRIVLRNGGVWVSILMVE